MPESTIIEMLPNLSIGVVSVLGLIYVSRVYLQAIDRRDERHASAMKEREQALRDVEKDVRSNLYAHLSESTAALQENTKVLSRVISHLDSN